MEDLQKTKEMSDSINEIAQALSNAQSELENVGKDSKGYGYNYSDLASTIKSVKPVLAKNNLAITQLLGNTVDNKASVITILTHQSGQYFRSQSSIDIIDMKGCNSAQSQGASISYLRRYAYQAILGLSSEDLDASSSGNVKQEVKKQDKPKTSAPSAWA